MSKTTNKNVWRMPFLLGALTLFGLLSALLGTGIWYWLAWAAMSIPVMIMVWKILSQKNAANKVG